MIHKLVDESSKKTYELLVTFELYRFKFENQSSDYEEESQEVDVSLQIKWEY